MYIVTTDINECLNNNSGCSHDCVNTVGSYDCEWSAGYVLLPNNHDCEGWPDMCVISLCYYNIMCRSKVEPRMNVNNN